MRNTSYYLRSGPQKRRFTWGNALSMERKFFVLRSKAAQCAIRRACNVRQLWQSEFAWQPQSSKYKAHQLSLTVQQKHHKLIVNFLLNCNIFPHSPRSSFLRHHRLMPNYCEIKKANFPQSIAMEQSHHNAETNKSVLNKYLTLDQGNRYNMKFSSADNLNWKLNYILYVPSSRDY